MDEATLNQVRAAEPATSTWLAANAGSGKTKVLIDRVARLLLHGTPPQRILCLTYTKAAASEMQNRLFQRLGDWAMLDDAALGAALEAMGETVADPDLLPRARRLFAAAIETPGGLKIQTIHAFCSSLLRRFPLEAAVSPDFAEVEERSLEQLRRALLDRFSRGPEAAALEALLRRLGEEQFSHFLAELGAHRDAFEGPEPDFDALFELPKGLTEEALAARVFDGDEGDLFARLAARLPQGGANDAKLGAFFATLGAPGFAILSVLESKLLYGEKVTTAEPFSAKTGKLVSKAGRAPVGPDDLEALDALAERVAEARPLRMGLHARRMAEALHGFARLWLPAFDAAKAARGWLDFDDLIRLARRLLSVSEVAQWVLFKLDGGIDHILVDEAQDTSPGQWAVIDLLTQEFTAGQGAREMLRTIFVVGDRKQSIYSFQGADLRGFETTRDLFTRRLAESGQGLNAMELAHSFRSSDAILRLVDQCFAPARGGAGGLGGAPAHIAFHPALAGRVDLWPALPRAERAEETEWDDPLDRPVPDNPDIVLARTLAAEIRVMIERGERIEGKGGPRPVHEGDFLILVRRRKLLFEQIIRACKAEGLAIAGADRLRLSEELAIKDLIALLKFLALPEDDLSLATVLRSPLFGLGEDALFRLAHGRPGFLWERLRGDPAHEAVRAVLDDLRGQVDFLRPYELVERVLTRHDGRHRIRARFGAEVEEALEAFVDLALTYETTQVPSLDGFLGWLEASDAEVKRQSEGAGRQIRVMTVHGSKGLEAPIVILPDTGVRGDPERAVLTEVAGVPILRAVKAEASAAQRAADAAAAQLRAEESDRLLYVALTRAERWLIVCGAGDTEAPGSWYAQVAAAMADLAPVPLQTPLGEGQRHAHGAWPAPAHGAWPAPAPAPAEAAPEAPAIDLPPLPAPGVALPSLSPSALGGAKALPGEGDETPVALARGTLIHRLLEELAELDAPERAARGAALVAGADPALARPCLAEALAVLESPALAEAFGPDALVEAGVSGHWNGRVLWGILDRLIVTPARVLAVDFKSNRVVPREAGAVPEGLLRQMGAYAHLLGALYPGRRIDMALLWTAEASLMPLDPAALAAALGRAADALDPVTAAP